MRRPRHEQDPLFYELSAQEEQEYLEDEEARDEAEESEAIEQVFG